MSEIPQKLPPVLASSFRKTLKFMNLFVAAGGLIMAVTFCAVVIIRYGFSGNLFAYEEWLLAICFWVFFFGAALAAERKAHVNADILGAILQNAKLVWWRATLVYIIEIGIGSYIVYWCFLSVQSEIIAYPLWETTSALKIPAIVPRLAILTGFAFMALFSITYFILHLIDGPNTNSPAPAKDKA